jgi:hypothetical protein
MANSNGFVHPSMAPAGKMANTPFFIPVYDRKEVKKISPEGPMRKLNYRCFSIYAEPGRKPNGSFDVRVILQKIGTSKITLHRPNPAQPTAKKAEDLGIETGKEIVDEKNCPKS